MTCERRQPPRIAVLLLCAGLPLACTPPELPQEAAPAAAAGPPATVDLPPIIKLEGTLPPETHPDHTMRVDGLLARKDKHLDQKVIVRGYLVEKYVRPEGAQRFERPHAWLADAPAGGDKRLMLVNIDETIDAALKVGEQYVVTGTFATQSGDGFVLSTGLLIYESIEGLEIPEDDKPKPK